MITSVLIKDRKGLFITASGFQDSEYKWTIYDVQSVLDLDFRTKRKTSMMKCGMRKD